jgi:DNA-binding transcriptional regulator GbsR (MarR family)
MARPSKTPPPPAPVWETTVLEAVGRVIEFWGFKRNHGRVWALLYLADEPMRGTTLGRRLGLSKGAVSIVMRELQAWAVIRRVPEDSHAGIAYAAERDLWVMIETVIRQRESRLVEQVREDLFAAEEAAKSDTTLTPAQRKVIAKRIRNLRRFADAGRVALEAFMKTRRFNLDPLRKVLATGVLSRVSRKAKKR